MKKIVLFACLLGIVACSKPDPYDKVRILRRNFDLQLDITVDKDNNISYEIKLQNLNSNADLQDLTVDVELLDEDQNVIWKKRKELDVTGLGSYSTKAFQYKDSGPEGAADWAYKNLRLAPDDENSDFKNYKEFMRVIK